jgi:hypothetical protein
VGQTEIIEAKCKEPRRHIHLDQPDKSAVAEHSINTALHQLQQHHHFGQNIKVCGSSCESGHLQNNQNFNRDGGLMLSRAWHQEAGLTQQALDTNQQLPLASAP